MQNPRFWRLLGWTASLGWMGLIFWFSSQNAVESSQSSDTFLNFLLRLFGLDPVSSWLSDSYTYSLLTFVLRKGAHFSIYTVLGMLLCMTISLYSSTTTLQKLLFPFFLGILYACTDEWHQSFVPGRSCQFRDICIDSIGVFFGILLILLIGGQIRRHRKKQQVSKR